MMGFVCAVVDCSNCQSGITEGYRPYFRFPINRRELCEQWIIECRRTDKFNPADFRVCPDHFSADDFERDVESELMHRMRLKPDAVPRLHPNRLKIEEDEDEILPDSGSTTSEKVIQRSFDPENGGCVVCGDLNCLSIQSSESDMELMKAWRAGWAKLLCKMLDVGSGYEETFLEGKFCSRCQEMVCKGEAAMNFLLHLQNQLKEVEKKLQQLFHNKDSIKIESHDESDDDMESIINSVRFDRLNYNWTPPTVDYNYWTPPAADPVTSAIDPLSGFGEDGLIPVKKRPTISRLKELKQRQEHRPPTSPLTASRRGPGRPRKKVVESQPMETDTDPFDGVHNTDLVALPLTTERQVSLDGMELKQDDDDFGDLGPHQFENVFASFMQLGDTETRDGETEATGGEDLNLHSTELASTSEDFSTNAADQAKQKQLQNAFPDWRLPQRASRYICNHPDCFSRDLCFSRPTLVRTHCQTEHPGQGLDLTPYHCSNCQERFVTADNLRLHKLQTHPELDPNKYGCPFCAQKFHSSGSLGTHLRYCKSNNTSTKAKTEPKPAKVKILPCPICGKTFEWPEEAEHHATLHGKDEPRKQKTCVMCSSVDKPKVFRSKAELRRHVNFSHNIPESIPPRVLSKGKRAKKASLRMRLNRARIVMQIRRSEREHLKKDVIFCNFPKCMASNAIFSSRLRLRTHLRTEHKFTVLEALCTYHCDKCELRFEHFGQLDEHKRRAKLDPRHDVDPEDPDDLFWSSTEREESAGRPKRTGKTADQAKPKLPTENYTSFLCSECGYFCKFNWQLQYHIQINHSATGVIKCKLCGKCFRGSQKEKEDAVRSHELLHSDDNVFGCVFCGKNLRSTIELAQHVRDVHEDFPFKCNEEGCGKGFELEVQYQKHMKNHTANARVYKCKECDFIARRSKGLHYHSIAKHSTEHKFPCTFEGCQRTFKFKLRRTLHLRRVHGVGVTQLYKCRICAMEFVVASSLTKHEQCHSKERPFICEICSASFKCKATLRQHYRVHNPDKKTGNNWKLQQPRKPRLKSSEAERLAHRMLEKAKAAKKTSTPAAAAVTGQIAESAEDTSVQSQQNNIPMSGTESASSLNLQQQVSCSSTVAQGHLPEVLPPGTSSLVEPSPALQHWHPPYPPTNLELSTVDPRIWQHFANYKNTPF